MSLDTPGIRRLVANTLLAQKRWHEAGALPERLTPADLPRWPIETLKAFYLGGSIDVDELEALLDVALRSECAA